MHINELFRQKLKRSRNAGSTGKLIAEGKKTLRQIDRNSREAVILQYRFLSDLLKENRETEYGKKYGFDKIHTPEDYMSAVPFTVYDDYVPYIRRMMKGEDNLLSARTPVHYAVSTGSVGVPKYIPVSQAELDKYTRYTVLMAFGVAEEYYRTTTERGVPSGPGLNAVEMQILQTGNGVDKGSISASLIKSMKDFIPSMLSSPWEILWPDRKMDMRYLKALLALGNRDLVFMDSVFMTGLVDLMDYIRENYEMLCRDICHGRINKSVDIPQEVRETLREELKPDRRRAEELMREFRRGFDDPIIPRIWPKMSWIGGIGTGGFAPYAKRMRAYSGKSIPFNNLCYAASESLIAAARHIGDESFVLIPDGGFYEFIPVRAKDDTKTLTIENLEVGEYYEIVITNNSGFYRYRLGDVVCVTGFYNEAPVLRFVYRKNQILSIVGEKTNEEMLRSAVENFSLETGETINDYSIFADTDDSPGHYIVLIEPGRIIPREKHAYYRDVMESMMMRANPLYGAEVRKGNLGPLEVVYVQQQTYMLYRELMASRGYSMNQLKPVRVIDTPFKERFFFGLKEKEDAEET